MPPESSTTKEEALLLLSKWHKEQTPLFMVLSAGDPSASTRFNMPARIIELDPALVISHPHGSADGFLKCPWSEIHAFSYMEMRAEADRLAAFPGAPDFMRNRSILILSAAGDLLIRLVDLSLSY